VKYLIKSLTSLSLIIGGTALAQGPAAGPPVEKLSALYAVAAPFDANADGTLDDPEAQSLATAITSGDLELPAAPEGVNPHPVGASKRWAAMYAALAPFDSNGDGKLNADEVTAVVQAMREGKLRRPQFPSQR